MKKYLILFSSALILISVTTLGYLNWSNSKLCKGNLFYESSVVLTNSLTKKITAFDDRDLFYDVNSRFDATISKEKLQKATSAAEIVPLKADWATHPIQTLTVYIIHDSSETSATGNSNILNEEQIELLRSMNYSDNFHFLATCKGRHPSVPHRENYDLAYYLTVTPEKEAVYSNGKDELISYIKEKNKYLSTLFNKDLLNPGRVNFTVTKNGTVANVKLSSSSGYSYLDNIMIGIINNLPGFWHPATDSKGVNVDQELVFFFGAAGC